MARTIPAAQALLVTRRTHVKRVSLVDKTITALASTTAKRALPVNAEVRRFAMAASVLILISASTVELALWKPVRKALAASTTSASTPA